MARSWTSGRPHGTGADFEISPILKPLEPFKKHLTVVSGLENKPATGPPCTPSRPAPG